ncbi:hypothetical protein [Arthrobacter sp. NPDC057009]|uniref:hypothetical protein n=1 Tax=Arthrobacter sp. NPDC057009 TaxID=3345996 RepID=UPI00362E17D6
MVPAFRAEELIELDEMLDCYGGTEPEPSAVLVVQDEPQAVVLGEWYREHSVLLMTYLVVTAALRGTGLGSLLLESAMTRWVSGSPGALVLAEVDDPRSWPGDMATGIALDRLRFYGRHGATIIPLQYFQPALRFDSDRVPGMFLLRLDRTEHVRPGILEEFLREYFTVCEGAASLTDSAVASLLRSAAGVDMNRGLWPVNRWEEMPYRK